MTKDAGPAIGSTESPATGKRSGRDSVSVLIVDDSPVFRRGMVRAVQVHAGLELIGEADGGHAALEAIDRLRPDVVLLDLRMPDLDGFGVLEHVRESGSRVLIVSASLDDETERAARAAGAAGCVSKDSPRVEICAAALRIARE